MHTSHIHTLLLMAVAAMAALTFVGPASAQIEVAVEGDQHCGHVSLTEHEPSGGCQINLSQEANTASTLTTHAPGFGETVISRCVSSYELNLEESGHGFITHQVLSEPPSGTPCGIEPCEEANDADKPWPLYLHEFANELSLVRTFCLLIGEVVERVCTIDLRINETSPHGAYEVFTRTPLASSSRCSQVPGLSLTGHWVQDGGDEIEIEHDES